MRAVAIICARNEEVHIRYSLEDLIGEGLDVVLIDHESVDRTAAIAGEFLGRGLLSIERLEWKGYFSLREQLNAKAHIVDKLDHDWIVHADADEWLTAPDAGQTLLEGLAMVDAAGYNCVNFSEFVFLPRMGEDFTGTNYRRRMTRYYFYRHHYPFLLRAWSRRSGLDNRQNAGHVFSNDAQWFPRDFQLRHYIALSEQQIEQKYLARKYADDELARGWHCDRVRATKENLRFPDDDRLQIFPDWHLKDFDTGRPHDKHYWEWPPEPQAF